MGYELCRDRIAYSSAHCHRLGGFKISSGMHDLELQGIKTLMRTHIEIRNRSFMRRVHRDCFLGSDAVDFLVTHGFADSRGNAEER